MNKFCDLHTHSNVSDGSDTPKELIAKAVEAGVSTVALCDHNTVHGLPEFLSAAEGKGITAVPGVEISVGLEGKELHLLGLFIPERAYSTLTEVMEPINRRKEQSNIDLIEALNRAGYKVDYEKIKAASPTGMFNRAQVGAELVEMGYVSSVKEAMKTILHKSRGYYKEPERVPVLDVIDVMKSLDVVPVLAHPLQDITDKELEAFLPKAKNTGLAGIECYYSEYDPAKTEAAMKLAETFGLKYSGGSDYHGTNKPDIRLGRGLGDLYVPDEWAQILAHR